MTPTPQSPSEYRVDDNGSLEDASANGVYRFVIAVEGQPIIRKRSNGQSFHLGYRQESIATRELFNVQQHLPDAEVVDMQNLEPA